MRSGNAVAAVEQARVRPQPAPAASCSGANPTPNQLVEYCEAEWNRYTDKGYYGFTGWTTVGEAALKASSADLRSGAWLLEVSRRSTYAKTKSAELQAFGACLARGVLAGRNRTFRTPSMRVKTGERVVTTKNPRILVTGILLAIPPAPSAEPTEEKRTFALMFTALEARDLNFRQSESNEPNPPALLSNNSPIKKS